MRFPTLLESTVALIGDATLAHWDKGGVLAQANTHTYPTHFQPSKRVPALTAPLSLRAVVIPTQTVLLMPPVESRPQLYLSQPTLAKVSNFI